MDQAVQSLPKKQRPWAHTPILAGCPWLTPVIPAIQEQRPGGLQFEASPAIIWETLSQKNPSQKRGDGVAQGVDPEFKPSTEKKKYWRGEGAGKGEGRKEEKKEAKWFNNKGGVTVGIGEMQVSECA
jgi:hypothetical protein